MSARDDIIDLDNNIEELLRHSVYTEDQLDEIVDEARVYTKRLRAAFDSGQLIERVPGVVTD